MFFHRYLSSLYRRPPPRNRHAAVHIHEFSLVLLHSVYYFMCLEATVPTEKQERESFSQRAAATREQPRPEPSMPRLDSLPGVCVDARAPVLARGQEDPWRDATKK